MFALHSGQKVNWTEAVGFCRQKGGIRRDLASINSPEENGEIKLQCIINWFLFVQIIYLDPSFLLKINKAFPAFGCVILLKVCLTISYVFVF